MKIISISFSRDIEIEELSYRWYRVPHPFTIRIDLGCVVKYVDVDAGFLFDGRSGGPGIDFFAPNLGSQAEIKSWLLHDLGSYDLIGVTFEENNELLYFSLVRYADYWKIKASTIKFFVGIKDSYFGVPLEGDREYPNVEKIHLRNWDK